MPDTPNRPGPRRPGTPGRQPTSRSDARPAGQRPRHAGASRREGSPEPRADRQQRPYFPPQPKKGRPTVLDVDALLAHANDPNVDLLAEAEREIEEDLAAEALVARSGPPPNLANLGILKQVLRRYGIRPSKSYGQNFLVNREVLDAILAAADVQPDENALEVGAGTGVLTIELAKRAQRVVAVEIDQGILPVLHETTSSFSNVEIIPRDLLDVQPAEVFGEEPYKLVANLPYYITALTLRHFLESANPPRRLVIMVQKEVAERIAAKPGDMSLLGLSVQFYGVPTLVARVPAASFYPAPQVDSAVVRIDLRLEPPLTGAARDRLFALANAGFGEKRKQLHNSLTRNLHVPAETVHRWLAEAAIEPARRAETLSVDDWVRLTQTVLASS